MPVDVPKGLLTIRQAAELVDVQPWTMKRRLLVLHERHGGLLVAFNDPGTPVRKWYVHPADLLRVWTREHAKDDFDEAAATTQRVEDLEAKLIALRGVLRKTRAELRAVEVRLARLEGSQLRDVRRSAA